MPVNRIYYPAVLVIILSLVATGVWAAEVVETSTAARSVHRDTPDTVYGGASVIWRSESRGDTAARKAYYKFDVSNIVEEEVVATASLSFVVYDPTYAGGTPPVAGHTYTYSVYGVTVGDDDWAHDQLTWNNAPGNDTNSNTGMIGGQSVLLGQFDVYESGTAGQQVTISGGALVEFLNARRFSTGLATVVIVQERTVGVSGFAQLFGSQRNAPYAPRLVMNTRVWEVAETSIAARSVYQVNPDSVYGGTSIIYRTEVRGDAAARKAYYKFDVSNMAENEVVDTASLTFIVYDPNYLGSPPVSGHTYTYSVYGVTIGDDDWAHDELTWNNAPGNDTASNTGMIDNHSVLLGQFEIYEAGAPGQEVSISGSALVEFLNSQRFKTGLATVVIVQERTPGVSAAPQLFGSQRNPTYAPRLVMYTRIWEGTEAAAGFDDSGAFHIGNVRLDDGQLKMHEEVLLQFYIRTHAWRYQTQLDNISWNSSPPTIEYTQNHTELTDGMVGLSTYECDLHRQSDRKFQIQWQADTTESAAQYSQLNDAGMLLRLEIEDDIVLKVNGTAIDFSTIPESLSSSPQPLHGSGAIQSIRVEFPSGNPPFVITNFSGVSAWLLLRDANYISLAVRTPNPLGSALTFSATVEAVDEPLQQVQSEAFKFRRSHEGWFAIDPPANLSFMSAPSFNFVDVSDVVLDAPAGQYGFLEVRDGGFYFENSPNRVYLAGTTLVHGSKFPPKNEAEVLAERIAASGCKIVRLHHLDYYTAGLGLFDRTTFDTSTENFDDELIDRMDYMIYQLKQRGVYVHMDGLSARVFKSGDNVPEYDELTYGLKGTAYLYTHQILSQKQKSFMEKLWTHQNPYTGLAYKDDPAIATAEIVNENDLYTHGSIENHFPPTYEQHFDDMWSEWCIRTYGPSQGLIQYNLKSYGVVRQFRMETMRDYYRMMYMHLRSLGVKIPLTGTNWIHPGTPIAIYAAHKDMDFTADHPYGADEYYKYTPYSSQSRAGLLSLSKYKDKPVVHNEWNMTSGAKSEGVVRASSILYQIAAMSAAGHDGSYHFAMFHGSRGYAASWIDSLNIGWDPAVRALLPAAMILMNRGDITRPEFEAVYTPTIAQVVDMGAVTKDDFGQTFSGFSRAAFGASASIDYSNVTFGTPQISFTPFFSQSGDPNLVTVAGGSTAMNNMLPNEQTYPAANTTGQFVSYWHEENRYFLVKTPKSKWAVGYLPGNQAIDLGDGVSITLDESQYACVTVTSLNDSAITASEQIMICTVSYVEQEQMYFDRKWRYPRNLSPTAQLLCKPVRAQLTLPTGGGDRTLLAKLHDGSVSTSEILNSVDGTMEIDLDEDVLAYELQPGPQQMGAFVFYNESYFDGDDPKASQLDDEAIATDKKPLLPGQTATFDNYTSYSRGITGIMIDMQVPMAELKSEDFRFLMGNSENLMQWQDAPAPETVTVRRGQGVAGQDRVTLIWPDGAIKNTWLRVEVLPTPNTGGINVVFYFGNAIGETGNSPNDAVVDAQDAARVRANAQSRYEGTTHVTNPFDICRSGRIGPADEVWVRRSQNAQPLKLISAP